MAFTFDGKNGALHLVDGETRYQVTDKGVHSIAADGFESVAIESADAQRALNQAMIHAEENGVKLSADAKKALHSSIQHIEGVDPDRLTKVKEALAAAKSVESAADNEAITAIFNKNPLAKDFITEEGNKVLAAKNFDMPAHRATAEKAAKKAADIAKAKEGLTKLMSAEKLDAPQISKFVNENKRYLADLKPTDQLIANVKAVTKYDFTKHVGDIEASVKTAVEEAKTAAAEFIKQQSIIDTKPKAETLETATKARDAAKGKIDELLKHEHADVIKSRIPEEVVKDVHKVSPEMGAKLGASANDGAKGRGFFAKLFEFKRTDKFMEELAVKEKSTVGEMVKKHGAIGSTRWGKVAAGAAVVTAAVVGGMSYFGKDKEPNKSFAEAEMQKLAAAGQAAGSVLGA